MKSWVINLLLSVAACTAVYCFTRKFDAPTDEDKLKISTRGLQRYIVPGSYVLFRTDVPEADVNLLHLNYFLAPLNLNMRQRSTNDTTLLLLQINNSSRDTAIAALLSRSSVIWQHKDERYDYILIHHS